MPDVQATNKTDSPSGTDGTSPGGQPKPSGATDQASTPKDPLVELHNFAEEYADKKHSKLDRQISSLTKERDSLKQQLDELSQADFDKKKADAIEAAKLDGDPARLKAVQAHYQAIEDTESKRKSLAEVDAEIESKRDLLERLNEAGKVNRAKELETETGVSAELILKLFNEQELTEISQMESLAKTLKEHVAKRADEKKLPFPSSTPGPGSGADVSSMSPDEKIRYALSRPNK